MAPVPRCYPLLPDHLRGPWPPASVLSTAARPSARRLGVIHCVFRTLTALLPSLATGGRLTCSTSSSIQRLQRLPHSARRSVDYRVPLGGSKRRRAGSSQRQRGSGPKGARHRGRTGACGQAGNGHLRCPLWYVVGSWLTTAYIAISTSKASAPPLVPASCQVRPRSPSCH